MNEQVLRMKYHPAKKEILFQRFQNNKEIPIRSDSRLKKYMNKKGKFVLQDYGNDFFNDIATVFDGLESVSIEVITTKLDYEDFLQMVEYYNEEGKCKIYPTLLAELPNMEHTFNDVIAYGKKAAEILSYHKSELFNIPLGNIAVRQNAENFAVLFQEEIKKINEKISDLRDNSVNLCFTGVYSSGKSALINTILGYRILPEKIKSETAKMFTISSPKDNENVKICFDYLGVYTELEWNSDSDRFEVSNGNYESEALTELQQIINESMAENCKQHEQMYRLLEKINSSQEVSSTIIVKFPVPLDNDNVQFTIYDTPGTDSNCIEHQQVLEQALEEQHQSILIFVVNPDRLEGNGNNALLNYLKEAENKSSKTSIDLCRSLFVINKADTVDSDCRTDLQYAIIKNEDDESFSINLSDKKLFFTSAKYAYASRAIKNRIATDKENKLVNLGTSLFETEGSPYMEDRCATSETATKNLIDRCEEALRKADGDDTEILLITSGMYALESEIKIYGEKYASAVKAFAIIDSVDKAFSKLTNQTQSIRASNMKSIDEKNNEINELKETINTSIDAKYREIAIPDGTRLPDKISKSLGINEDTLTNRIMDPSKKSIDKNTKDRFLGLVKAKAKEKYRERIQSNIGEILKSFSDNFIAERKKLLESQRDTFITAIQKAINENGRISEEGKKIFMDIPAPDVKPPSSFSEEIEEIYNSNKISGKFLWKNKEYINKEEFSKQVEENLLKFSREMCDEFAKDYRSSLDTLLEQVKSAFTTKLDEYSLTMKALIEDREAMIALGDRIGDAAQALSDCQNDLNRIIWKEVSND